MANTQASFKSRRPGKFLIPALVGFAVAVVGIYFLVDSSAATGTQVQFLNHQHIEQSQGVITSTTVDVPSLGQQTVSKVPPGAKLSYLVGGKVAVKNQCYYILVSPQAGGSTTATIEFVGQGRSTTRNLTYDAANPYLQRVCVPSGTQTSKSYNVYNKSPVGGPDVLVYQDEVIM
jgi:hypothetical protein